MNLFATDKQRYLLITFFAFLLAILFSRVSGLSLHANLICNFTVGFMSLYFYQAVRNFLSLTILTIVFMTIIRMIINFSSPVLFVKMFKAACTGFLPLLMISLPVFLLGFGIRYAVIKLSK
ncbi:hypothetical protein CIK05_03600 [Bdellovibrio sp. qaytius]|nr:hypothetical protein CIK05_03600 [Bdellovibrio sp. qaytius]